MRRSAQHVRPQRASAWSGWQVPAALLALSAVPFVAGLVRLIELSSRAAVTPDNARFFAAPLPVVAHILGASLFSVFGALQFAPGFRSANRSWHRLAGWVVVVAGMAAALSGLWMTQFYPLPAQLQGGLLYSARLLVGAAMAASLVLGAAAAIGRRYADHWTWLTRAYALGQGAGTQVLVMLPWALLLGEATGPTRDRLMASAWLINLAVAEWIIRRRAESRGRRAAHVP